MPNLNLGAGVPNNTNLSFTPTWLFTPSTYATNNVRLVNNGRNIVYVGQANVTTTTGLPILPGSRPIELTNVLTPLYGISAVQQGTLQGTVTVTSTAGTTTLTMSAAAVTSLSAVAGTAFIIGSTTNTANQEVLTVASSTGTTVLTTNQPAQFAHDTTNVVYSCTPSYGQLSVFAGVI